MQRRDNITAAAPPPPGVTPNFAQPEDVLYTINFVTQIASMALVTPFVAMRVLVKAYISPPFLVEDYVCVLAWVLSTAYSVTAILMYKFGGGYHVYELSVEKYEGFLKALYADTLVYGLNAYFTKVALLLVIARVFNSFRKTRIITFLLVGAMAFYYAPMLFLKMNVCRPISGFWTPLASMEPGAPAPVCLNQRAMFVADTIISAITDTAVLIIPIPATVSLRMPWQRRLKVWSMLGLGEWPQLRASTAEVGIGLICACLPAINMVFAKTNEQSAHAESEGSSPSAYFQRLKFLRGSRLQTATDMSLGTRARPTTTANEDAIEMMGIEEELQSDGTREAQWAAAAGNHIVRGSRQLGTQPEATRRS
ncbi:hypothetical protein MCOR01_009159 [Pyricularia oryzae]|nr:hypothetical protein MCOR01_009159 [Pyricularia oryzae]